jgi:hypothetical protein
VAEIWNLEETTLTPQTSFAGGMGGGRGPAPPAPPQSPDGPGGPEELPTDSLELVELMMALEEEFDLSLSDADTDRVYGLTLVELADEIERLRLLRNDRSVEGEAA